ALICVSFFTLAAILLAQTSLLVFFLMAAAWRLLDKRWDRAAGIVIGLVAFKPQLTVVLVLALLLWSACERRCGVWQGFVGILAVLSLACLVVLPNWPIEMLTATRKTPPPTDYFPWIGNTWFLVLKSMGLRSWAVWPLYLLVALPFLGAVVRAAW